MICNPSLLYHKYIKQYYAIIVYTWYMTEIYTPQAQESPEMVRALKVGQELSAITQAAAVAVAPHVGFGDEIAADQAAVGAMEARLRSNHIFGCRVVIGEGDKDDAPMLTHGEEFNGNPDLIYDFAVDPLEGTSFAATGTSGAMAVAALAPPDTFPSWADIPYMHKLVVGPYVAKLLDVCDVSIAGDPVENMRRIAIMLGKPQGALRIAVLDRERNSRILEAIEKIGAQAVLLSGGDIIPALQTCLPDPEVDMLYSSGGAPEAVLTAAAIATMGGNMQVMWDPQTRQERMRAQRLDQHNKVLTLPQIVGTGELFFAATAITKNPLLDGCRFDEDGNWQPGQTLLSYRTMPVVSRVVSNIA